MTIEIEVSGGYGGLFAKQPLSHQLDVDLLAEPTRSELLALVDSSGVRTLQLPAEPGLAPRGQTYRITLRDGAGSNSIVCDDASAPASLRPLLARLQQLALAARKPPAAS